VTGLAQSSGLPSSTGKSTALAVLVHRVAYPVDPRIIPDLSMGRIYKNNLIIFHGGILVDPVRVQNTKVGIHASHLLLSNGLKIPLKLKVVDTLMLGLTKDHTTVILTLAASTTNSDANYNISLLRLVSETVGLVRTGGLVAAYHLGALTVFPCADAEEETEGVSLLVTP